MQSPDVNVLVSAFRQDTSHHDRCRAWLDDVLSGRGQVGSGRPVGARAQWCVAGVDSSPDLPPADTGRHGCRVHRCAPRATGIRRASAGGRSLAHLPRSRRNASTHGHSDSGRLSCRPGDRTRLRMGHPGPGVLRVSRIARDQPSGRLTPDPARRRPGTQKGRRLHRGTREPAPGTGLPADLARRRLVLGSEAGLPVGRRHRTVLTAAPPAGRGGAFEWTTTSSGRSATPRTRRCSRRWIFGPSPPPFDSEPACRAFNPSPCVGSATHRARPAGLREARRRQQAAPGPAPGRRPARRTRPASRAPAPTPAPRCRNAPPAP